MEGQNNEIDRLPEACVSHVLSLTSPRDSCRAAVLSPTFRQAADSDTVWIKFLPSDYRQIISRAVDPLSFSSYKELYFKFCDSVLIDGGKKVISLEKETGAKCLMLHAKELSVPWVDDQRYWRWVSHPDSRFSVVAELSLVCWLQVEGRVDCSELSHNTTYKAYLVFKIAREGYGLRSPPQEVSVRLGTQISEGKACIYPSERMGMNRLELPAEVRVPRARVDGWMEVELGEFHNEDGTEGDARVSFKHVQSMHWKHGLVIEGVQVRPRLEINSIY